MSGKSGRPPFIDPHTEFVECFVCGVAVDPADAGGIDLSDPDEYYPDMKPTCPNHADPGGSDE